MNNQFNEWISRHNEMIKKLTNINNENSVKIRWKGVKVNNYRKNWQYSITKEVIGMHEVIDPYDWNLDVEENPDFKEWEQEIKNRKEKNND